MGNSSEASDFLLALYDDASRCMPDEFRLRTLKNLQRFIPFDFAVWGGGQASRRLVTDLLVLDQSEALLGEWEAVADQDAFCDLALRRLGATARFDDVPDYRRSLAYNDHWRRFDALQMMATITAEPCDGYVSFVGLCADGRPAAFSEAERVFKQLLMPHLSQALRMNRAMWAGRAVMDREAVALVNEAGWVLATHGPFGDFAEAEWGGRISRIPPEIMGALHGGASWRGASVNASLSRFGRHYFIRLSVQPALACLSLRERQVAEFFASGMTSKQVARALGTSPSTVRNQVVRIYEKLEISSKAALASLVARA